MSFRLYSSRSKLLAGCLVLAIPLSAAAMPPPGPPMGPPPDQFSGDRPPPYLMGLTLTEDQQDKVFAILHASAPSLRDQFKAVHKAREALHELGHSAQFDSGNASSLAQALGKAESQLALILARNDHDIYAVLTDEQRKQLADREHEQGPRHREPPAH